MLKAMTWGNFKIFGEPTTIPLGRVTVLTGINGRGKSTALQPLLCLAQSGLLDFGHPVHLDGAFARLGTAREIRNRKIPDREPTTWQLEIEDDEPVLVTLTLRPDEREPSFLKIVRATSEFPARDADTPFVWTPRHPAEYPNVVSAFDAVNAYIKPVAQSDLRYVSADRLGPQSFVAREVLEGRLSVGARGQHTVEVLGRAQDDGVTVAEGRLAPNADLVAHTVFDQAVAWMNWVFDGVGLRVESTEVVRTIGLNADGGAQYARPSNIGFGFTCLLPLIVEGLLAAPGTLLVIENPEAHLHPAAVSRFARFVVALANDRVQVCVETHSEHLVNGLRLAVAGLGDQPRIAADDVCILYFRRHETAPVLRVELDDRGRISTWPDGFFDTAAQDLARLHGV